MTAQAAVASPCISVCVMDADAGWCLGCYRTLAEISAWIDYSPAQKQEVLDKIRLRCKSAPPPAIGDH